MPREIHNEPSETAAEEGAVIVDGPDGVAVTLTPEAAEETAIDCRTALRRHWASAMSKRYAIDRITDVCRKS